MQIYKPEGVQANVRQYTRQDVEKAMVSGEILSGYVTKCDSNYTLHVRLGDHVYGEIEFDELEFNPYGDNQKPIAAITKVGKIVNFKVAGYSSDGETVNVQLSRKAAMREAYIKYVDKLVPGDVVDARITHVESYGAFCDIACGLTYLLPIENLCVTRISNAVEALRGVTDIKAVVLGKNKQGKIILTHRELLGTWEHEANKFQAGNVIVGTVRSKESYGVFIELTQNLSGLAEPTDDVEVGDQVSVMIKSIIPDKMKIKLALVNMEQTATEKSQKLTFEYDKEYKAGDHIDYWKYQPDACKKLIETKFNG